MSAVNINQLEGRREESKSYINKFFSRGSGIGTLLLLFSVLVLLSIRISRKTYLIVYDLDMISNYIGSTTVLDPVEERNLIDRAMVIANKHNKNYSSGFDDVWVETRKINLLKSQNDGETIKKKLDFVLKDNDTINNKESGKASNETIYELENDKINKNFTSNNFNSKQALDVNSSNETVPEKKLTIVPRMHIPADEEANSEAKEDNKQENKNESVDEVDTKNVPDSKNQTQLLGKSDLKNGIQIENRVESQKKTKLYDDQNVETLDLDEKSESGRMNSLKTPEPLFDEKPENFIDHEETIDTKSNSTQSQQQTNPIRNLGELLTAKNSSVSDASIMTDESLETHNNTNLEYMPALKAVYTYNLLELIYILPNNFDILSKPNIFARTVDVIIEKFKEIKINSSSNRSSFLHVIEETIFTHFAAYNISKLLIVKVLLFTFIMLSHNEKSLYHIIFDVMIILMSSIFFIVELIYLIIMASPLDEYIKQTSSALLELSPNMRIIAGNMSKFLVYIELTLLLGALSAGIYSLYKDINIEKPVETINNEMKELLLENDL